MRRIQLIFSKVSMWFKSLGTDSHIIYLLWIGTKGHLKRRARAIERKERRQRHWSTPYVSKFKKLIGYYRYRWMLKTTTTYRALGSLRSYFLTFKKMALVNKIILFAIPATGLAVFFFTGWSFFLGGFFDLNFLAF